MSTQPPDLCMHVPESVCMPPATLRKQVMETRVQTAKEKYVCGDWMDEERTRVTVTRVATVVAPNLSTDVDLKKLEEGDWKGACAKQCNIYIEGLCVHVLCALEKKRTPTWRSLMKPWETISGAKK